MFPVVVCLIRPEDLSGRLGGGFRRFVEVAARIHLAGVQYVIIESEPFVKSFRYFESSRELAIYHRILSLHLPWHTASTRRVIGPIIFWLKIAVIVSRMVSAVRATGSCLVLAPGETLPEVLVAWICSRITRRLGVVLVQSDPFLMIRQYDAKGLGSFYAAYRTILYPVAAVLEALTARLQIHAMNEMVLLLVGGSLSQTLESRGMTGVVKIPVENGVDFGMIRAMQPSKVRSDAIFVGRIDSSKEVLRLVRAWCKVRDGERFKLVVIGPVEASQEAEVEATVANSDGRAVVLGALTDKEVISMMKSSRVLVLPSGFESFSLVTAEALACGVPVVCYESAGIREFFPTPAVSMVPEGEITALIDRGRELLENEQERSRLGKVGMHFVTRYDWGKVASQEARIYLRLAARTTMDTHTSKERIAET